jgi:hypothetical protein
VSIAQLCITGGNCRRLLCDCQRTAEWDT